MKFTIQEDDATICKLSAFHAFMKIGGNSDIFMCLNKDVFNSSLIQKRHINFVVMPSVRRRSVPDFYRDRIL